MAEQRISRQELIRRQRRTGFVGRQGELASFKEVLRLLPEEAVQFLFHVRGPAGVGKSTLVRQMEGAAREAQAFTAYVDESVTDAIEVMEAISAQFAQQGIPMKAFDKRLGTYRQRRHEADASAAAATPATEDGAGLPPTPAPSAATVVASQLGLVSLGMIPGVGAFTGAVDAQQVAAGASQLKAILSTKFSNRDDVQLVLSPLRELTPIFLEDLSEISQRRSWITLFIDTYERTGPILDSWLRDVLLSDKYGELPANVLAVLAGQSRLEERCWGDFADLITDLPLTVFTEAEARQLLATKGITDERVIEVILHLSGRLPVLVSTLAESRPSNVEEVGDPSGTAVERFLKWETDPARRAAALACALPQELDEDVYRAAVADEAESLFAWLKSMPFVNYRAGHCRYHNVVRETMLRLQRQQSPSRWQEQHENLADTFRQWRIGLEDGTPPANGWWGDERWRHYQIQELYHQLCANPRANLRNVLCTLIDAHEHGIGSVRRCVQVFLQAGWDADASRISNLGRQMLGSLEEGPTEGKDFLTILLAYTELLSEDRVRIYLARAKNLSRSEKYESALSDYTAALALDPTASRAHSGRGIIYQIMGRYEESLTDLDNALGIDATDAKTLTNRGLSHFFCNNTDAALVDFDRSIELDPANSWPYTARGFTYHALDRLDDAADSFRKSIEIEPENAGTYFARGLTYHSVKRYDDALSDFDRALDLNPADVTVLCSRGRTFDAMERYDDALCDFNRALDLEPQSATGYANRGLTYQSLRRYDDALADFNRVLDLDPQSAWTYLNRGLTSGHLERYDDALADFTKAIELDPEKPGFFGSRGLTYRALERYDDALADFTKAIELDPDESNFFSGRGLTYRALERYDDALADFTKAIELDPEKPGFFSGRGLTYRALERYDDALADFTKAIELDLSNAALYISRAQTLTDMRRFDSALEDLGRSLELDPCDSRAYSVRGHTYRTMRLFPDALGSYDKAIELAHDNAWYYGSRGDIHHDLAQFDQALADFDRALEVDPSNTTALHRQCLVLRLVGRYDDALVSCGKILQLENDDSEVHTDRGVLLRLMGRYGEALDSLNRAIELDSRHSWAHYEKSVVLYATAHPDRKRFLMRAIRIITQEPGGIERKGNLFLSSCLLPKWQRAENHFSDFISSEPTLGLLHQLLTAINSLANAIPSRESNMSDFRLRVEEQITRTEHTPLAQ
ncbi:tetratricopeptide repeat protein [Streptomyces sp. NPDC058122]|uniref:tetratricopeptide repeat protein n=1 Tax=Streptomyces sp. NPDC058122 TaxID=3346349 RepID=UPI0036ECD136